MQRAVEQEHKNLENKLYMHSINTALCQTRSHPEMVGDMSCVTLNSDLSKILFVRF